MPLTYSISTGLAFGFIASVLTATAAGRAAKVHPLMWGIAAFSVLDLVLRA
jgi:AGZA family xanthine/uracil permease-like MFS transporter